MLLDVKDSIAANLIMLDMIRYRTVKDWLCAIQAGTAMFIPKTCTVSYQTNQIILKDNSKLNPKADELTRAVLAGTPACCKETISPTIRVALDGDHLRIML